MTDPSLKTNISDLPHESAQVPRARRCAVGRPDPCRPGALRRSRPNDLWTCLHNRRRHDCRRDRSRQAEWRRRARSRAPATSFDDDCGPESRDEMHWIIGDEIVRCELNGERTYDRVIGVCFLSDGRDIGARTHQARPGARLSALVGRAVSSFRAGRRARAYRARRLLLRAATRHEPERNRQRLRQRRGAAWTGSSRDHLGGRSSMDRAVTSQRQMALGSFLHEPRGRLAPDEGPGGADALAELPEWFRASTGRRQGASGARSGDSGGG